MATVERLNAKAFQVVRRKDCRRKRRVVGEVSTDPRRPVIP